MNLFPAGPRLAFVLLLATGMAPAAPNPTPTPRPKLTGGFGKVAAPASAARAGSGRKEAIRITNQSLVTEPDKGKLSTSEARPAATAAAGARTPTPPAAPAGTPTAPALSGAPGSAPAEGEAYWRGEAQRLRERVAALRETIIRLQAEVSKLEGDFYSWDDGAYRDGVIKPAWDKAREELVTARRELPVAEKELAELPERARRAGAQPGWLRE